MNTIVHAIDGRLRLKVVKIKHNRAAATLLEESLRSIDGVKKVKATSSTGSVLIEYDEWQISANELAELFGVASPNNQHVLVWNGYPNLEPSRLRRVASEAFVRVLIEVACQILFARVFRLYSFR